MGQMVKLLGPMLSKHGMSTSLDEPFVKESSHFSQILFQMTFATLTSLKEISAALANGRVNVDLSCQGRVKELVLAIVKVIWKPQLGPAEASESYSRAVPYGDNSTWKLPEPNVVAKSSLSKKG